MRTARSLDNNHNMIVVGGFRGKRDHCWTTDGRRSDSGITCATNLTDEVVRLRVAWQFFEKAVVEFELRLHQSTMAEYTKFLS